MALRCRDRLVAGIAILAGGCAAVAAGPDDASVARAQLEVARQIQARAVAIVAITPRSITAEDPAAAPFRKQNYTVAGQVARCFKGRVSPPAGITYIITAEGRPAALGQPHIAFLRRMGTAWAAVDGPMFRDSAPMRAGLARITPGCAR